MSFRLRRGQEPRREALRPRVEPLRDAILAVSGRLDLRRPDGSSVTQLGQELARKISYEKINPGKNRRTVYLPGVRHYLPHMLQEFDFRRRASSSAAAP